VYDSNQLDYFFHAAKTLAIPLSPETIPQFQIYFQELLSWNEKVNLTRITKKKEVFLHHFIDSLMPERFIPPYSNVIDIGSGGGFPGIPLKIIRPDIIVRLVDSSIKKTFFQRHIIRTLELKGIAAVNRRVEDFTSSKKRCAVCIGRAFAPLPKFLCSSLNLMEPGGTIIAMKGPDFAHELKKTQKQLFQWGISVKHIEKFVIPYTKKKRAIIVFG